MLYRFAKRNPGNSMARISQKHAVRKKTVLFLNRTSICRSPV
jgi:hypothetical protein